MNLLALATVIIQLNIDGSVTASHVRLEPPPAGFSWVTCVQELGGPQLRCYAVNPDTMELQYADFEIVD